MEVTYGDKMGVLGALEVEVFMVKPAGVTFSVCRIPMAAHAQQGSTE